MSFVRIFFLIIVLLIPVACSTKRTGQVDWRDASVTRYWPAAVEKKHIELLRVVAGKEDLGKNTQVSSFFNWLTGTDDEKAPLVSPYGITSDGFGRVWLADPGAGVVHVYDLVKRSLSSLGMAGEQPLLSPVGVKFDSIRNRLYVSDSSQARVFAFSPSGELLFEVSLDSGFGRPAGMSINSRGDLHVADAVMGVVFVFDATGSYKKTIQSLTTSDGFFKGVSNVFIDAEDRLYVVDSLDFSVEVQSDDGLLVNVIGKAGDKPGAFARPRGVAVDSYGHIYVVDAAFDNIQVFDLAGSLLTFFGGPGSEPGRFCLPAGIDIDKNDRIYVADSCNYRFQVFQYLK